MPTWDLHYISVETTSFILGCLLGHYMHRSDFCMAGAFRDLFLLRRTTLIRPLLLLVVVSAILFEAARLVGLLPSLPFPMFAPPSLTNTAGGILFGTGMVLAGGCVVGVLYKMGSGSFLALLAFTGLLAGSALFAEIFPLWRKISLHMSLPTDATTLPQLLDVSPAYILFPLAAIAVFMFSAWRRKGLWNAPSHVEGYVQPWKAALVFAFCGLISAVVVGVPFGVTTTYAKAAAWIESIVAPEHLQSLVFFTATPIRYSLPFSDHILPGGAGPHWDAITFIQAPLIAGIVLGAFFSSKRLGEFRPSFRVPLRQVASALIGGTLMGIASRTTPGCNIWHLWGGLPSFTLQSILFLFGLLPGAWLGTKILMFFVLSEK